MCVLKASHNPLNSEIPPLPASFFLSRPEIHPPRPILFLAIRKRREYFLPPFRGEGECVQHLAASIEVSIPHGFWFSFGWVGLVWGERCFSGVFAVTLKVTPSPHFPPSLRCFMFSLYPPSTFISKLGFCFAPNPFSPRNVMYFLVIYMVCPIFFLYHFSRRIPAKTSYASFACSRTCRALP